MPDGKIFEVIEQFRLALLKRERKAASAIVRVYANAWREVRAMLDALEQEYQADKARGIQPGQNWIFQFNRARAFRNQVESVLLEFARFAEAKTLEEQREAIEAAQEQAERLARLMMGAATRQITIEWNRIDRAAIETLLGMVQPDSPLHRLFVGLSITGAQSAEDTLIRGMLLGKSPREVAPDLKKALGVPLYRALRIARTETMRAHREATRAEFQANADIVTGWIWFSAADRRTCAACWAMHGTVHPLSAILNDHPNGRCVMLPKVKTWSEIGREMGVDFGDFEEPPVVPKGIDLFQKLPEEYQKEILGPAKWQAWKNGLFAFEDVIGSKWSAEWGSYRFEKSLSQLIGNSGRRKNVLK